jgi:hypothetical protein
MFRAAVKADGGLPRRLIGAALAGAALLAAGCGPQDNPLGPTQSETRLGSAPVTTPDTRVDEVPTGEPGTDRRQWRAAGDPAVGLLGNLTASVVGGRSGQLVLAFANGVTARLERLADLRGQDGVGAGLGDFSRVMGVDPRAGVFVYMVVEELRSASAANGGLCRAEKATHVAVSEFVDGAGQWALRVASFKGPTPPGPAATGDPSLCAIFNYVVN